MLLYYLSFSFKSPVLYLKAIAMQRSALFVTHSSSLLKPKTPLILLTVVVAAALAGCGKGAPAGPGGPGGGHATA
jgi:hypothetical protein